MSEYQNKNLIVLCEHCSTKVSGTARFCKDCETAPKRKAMDDENNKLWQEREGRPYICKSKVCQKPEPIKA